MSPAQELHWLQRTAKGLPTPELIFVGSLPDAGGYFYHPRKCEMLVDGKFHPMDRGLLVVVANQNQAPDEVANAIAHEWRHFWQWFNLEHCYPSATYNPKNNYRQEILRFFKHPRELDALIFSHQIAPCWYSEMWLGWLKEEKACRIRGETDEQEDPSRMAIDGCPRLPTESGPQDLHSRPLQPHGEQPHNDAR